MMTVHQDFFPKYPGLEIFGTGIGEDHIFQDVVRKNLTQALGLKPLKSI